MSRLPPPDSLALLRELIAFPSITLTSNAALMDRVQAVLEQAGIASMRVPDPQDATRCNLYASVGPRGVAGILLSGHTDVVPVAGQPWTTPPFEATERDGRLYGRGAADMKGFVACAVMAMVRAARRPLRRPLLLALSFDEEIGCVGVRHLLRELEGLEPQPLLCVVGEPTLMQIGTGHKGKAAYRARCCGQAGHSGLAPRFVNAIHTATDLVGALRDVQRELAEQGPRVHIVLHQAMGDHHVAHLHVRMQPAGQAGEDHPGNLEFPDHDGRGRGGRHLADPAQRDHAGRAPQGAYVEIAHRDAVDGRAGIHRRQQVGDFFVQRTQDGQAFHRVLSH